MPFHSAKSSALYQNFSTTSSLRCMENKIHQRRTRALEKNVFRPPSSAGDIGESQREVHHATLTAETQDTPQAQA